MPIDTTYTDDSNELTKPPKDQEGIDKEKKTVEDWKTRIKSAGKFEEVWRREARNCRNIFVSKNANDKGIDTMFGNTLSIGLRPNRRPQANIFYSNVCFSRASILTKMPDILIRQRYSKQNSDDPLQKSAYSVIADIVQRSASVLIGTGYNTKEIMKFKDDALITGRGVLWVLFDSETDPKSKEAINETIKLKRIGLADFRISPARCWDEVSWIARRILLSKASVKEQYGEEVAKKIGMTYPNTEDKLDNSESGQVSFDHRAEIWEIWDKTKKEVIFIAEGLDEVLSKIPDPYGLEGFFPTPEPLLSIPKSDSMVPTPEYNIYRTEAMEIGNLSRRITSLVSNMRGRGFIPNTLIKSMKALQQARDDEFVLLDGQGVSQILDKGIGNMIQYEPIEERAKVVEILAGQIERQKNTIYEVTGLSDAMQIANQMTTTGGDVETATKTIMKGKFGSIRLQEKQAAFNEYIKEVFSIGAEFICRQVSMTTMQQITEIKLGEPNDPENTQITWEDAVNFLRDYGMSNYLLDVETDMNVWESDAEAQKTRAEMVGTFIDQLDKITQLASSTPAAVDYYTKSCEFVLDAYQMPSSLRNSFEDVLQKISQQIKDKVQQDQQNPPPPDAQTIIAQAEQTKAQAMSQDIQAKSQIQQQELELKSQQIMEESRQMEAKTRQSEIESNVRLQQIELEKYKIQTDFEIQKIKLSLEQEKLSIDMQNTSGTEQARLAGIHAKMQTQEKQMALIHEQKMAKLKNDQDIVSATLTQRALSEREKLSTQTDVAKIKAGTQRPPTMGGGIND
jgi:hypothetical protein